MVAQVYSWPSRRVRRPGIRRLSRLINIAICFLPGPSAGGDLPSPVLCEAEEVKPSKKTRRQNLPAGRIFDVNGVVAEMQVRVLERGRC
jgi:hypothetical protein